MKIKFRFFKSNDLQEIGEWLDTQMPNPPLPEPQRWTLIGPTEIEFSNEQDALLFKLRWE